MDYIMYGLITLGYTLAAALLTRAALSWRSREAYANWTLRVLMLSSTHLSQATMHRVARQGAATLLDGYVIRVPEDGEPAGCPMDLLQVLTLAQRARCDLVFLLPGAAEHPDLPIYPMARAN